MKNFFTYLLLLPFLLSAQITVLSAEDDRPLISANVVFECLEGKQAGIKHTRITDEKGQVVNPFEALTHVKISFLGYLSVSRKLEAGESTTIYLEREVTWVEDVVVTAQYAPGSAEKAVHQVKLIDQKRIAAQGAVNLRDVLSNEINIRLSQDNVLGSSTSIQGLSGQNVKILIDGVPVIGRLGGNIDLSQINLNNIERIEIIEGPLSVEYGTNALAGTINLITKKSQKSTAQLDVNSYYETVGSYNLDFLAGLNKGKNYFQLSGGRNYFDGWSPKDDFVKFPKDAPADTNRFQDWKPKEQLFGKLVYQRKLNQLKLRLSGNYFQEVISNRGMPRKPYFEYAFDDYYNTWRMDHLADLQGRLKNGANLHMIVARNDYKRIKNTYFKDLTTLEEELLDVASQQDTTLFDLWMLRGTYSTSNDSSKINYSIGYDLNLESGTGARIESGKQAIGDYALFGSAEYRPIEQLTLRPGLRVIYNSAYEAPVTPSLNVRFRTEGVTVRASWSKGFRAPSIKDLYFDFVDINHNIQGNPDLKAETSDNYHVSFTRQRHHYKVIAAAFYNDIQNLITLARGVGDSFSYFNLDEFKSTGIQLNTELSWESLQFTLGGSYVGRYNSLSEQTEVKPFNFSPELRSNLRYKIPSSGINLSIFYKYTGKVNGYYQDGEGAIQESVLGDFHTLDVSLARSFWKDRCELTLGGKNLLDVQDIQSTGSTGGAHSSNTGVVPMSWGRSLFVGLKFHFKSEKNES